MPPNIREIPLVPERSKYVSYLVWGTILSGIVASSFVNFLLFHTLAELFSIVITYSIFIVAWNTRHFTQNHYLLFLGIIYLSVGLLDLTHTLAYKGMNIFVGHGANLPTQLWIAARYLEGVCLAVAPLFFTRRLNVPLTFSVILGVVALLFASLFVWPVFPACFIEGTGLTPFKKISEYVICFILVGAMVNVYVHRSHLEYSILRLVVISLLLTIAGEIAFTFYVSVYGLSNLVGHLCKVVSFYLIYQAIVVGTLTNPYRSLFREVTQSEEAKEQVIAELQKALEEVKILQGFLPICASCKQIRDDKGYWNEIEKYLEEHSEVIFSHSFCPQCAEKLYPDFYSEADRQNGIKKLVN